MKVRDEGKVLDIVGEFANIGAGNAATALASLLDQGRALDLAAFVKDFVRARALGDEGMGGGHGPGPPGGLRPLYRRAGRKAKEAAGDAAERYSENPLHERALNWLRARHIPLISSAIHPREEKEKDKKKRAPKTAREPKIVAAEVPAATPGEWQLPKIELLDETVNAELSKADIERRARLIEEALASYGVDAKVKEKNVGPAVTQFEVEPGWDVKYKEVKEKDRYGNPKVRKEEVSRTRVKVERITALQNDLALALAAPSIRMEAPVPGKAVVGIEVPNTSSGLVSVREVLESTSFRRLNSKSPLAIALGKGTSGDMAVADLAKMPHVLVAGATGSGKTVCLDSTIISLLMNNTPRELRFIMIDSKRVELIAFDGIPHLMTPVITEGEKAVEILKWLTLEMDGRYRRLALMRPQDVEFTGTDGGPNTWMRKLHASATYTFPLGSTATPVGQENCPLPPPRPPRAGAAATSTTTATRTAAPPRAPTESTAPPWPAGSGCAPPRPRPCHAPTRCRARRRRSRARASCRAAAARARSAWLHQHHLQAVP